MWNAVRAGLFVGMLLVAFLVLPGCQPQPVQSPTPAPVPTSTPRGEDFHFSGVIESMSGGTWVIGGQSFKVDQNTRLDSGLAVGVRARVEYIVLSDGTRLAREIETP